MTNADHIAAARATLIESVVDQRGIKLRGRIERVGPCPKCGGEDRFSINIKKQVWNCRGCDIGGDVIKLVEHLDNIDFASAVLLLAGEPPPKINGKDRRTEFFYTDASGTVVQEKNVPAKAS
jgi:hypothetical protein